MIASNSVRWLLDDCCLYEQTASGKLRLNITELAGNLAYHAMMLEAHLTPKAGLVDCSSSGAHFDMDIDTFVRSSQALRPYMKQFVRAGMDMHKLEAEQILPGLRQVGIEAENAMLAATSNINTHKGMVFTLGLICGAVGWLYKNNQPFDAIHVRGVIIRCCAELVKTDLQSGLKQPATAGERIYQQHGLPGIRGEAAQGYPTIFQYGLPVYETCISNQYSEEQAMQMTLLSLMVYNGDTNLINRGGIEGLQFVQDRSQQLLSELYLDPSQMEPSIKAFDEVLIKKNLSPGGSADLLAATWLLAQLNLCSR